MDQLEELKLYMEEYSTYPTVETMPRRNLSDKGIKGPTGAHVIEEIHTPFNLSYITVTTGTTAFQNIVGVTKYEIEDRVLASIKALKLAGVEKYDKILITYPPLVNVFPKQAFEEYGVDWYFLNSSSRDALVYTMCKDKPKVVIGESSFLRASIEDAVKMNLRDSLPKQVIFLAAGTPLDQELPVTAKNVMNSQVHDLYGCQEFGWLTLDGILLRDDISLIPAGEKDEYDMVVGGLPTGDRFPVLDEGHLCNKEGKVITYARMRTEPELETVLLQTTANNKISVERLAKTILRIKGKIVRVDSDLDIKAGHTKLSLKYYGAETEEVIMEGPEKTKLVDSLLAAQLDYQDNTKRDPAWIKDR